MTELAKLMKSVEEATAALERAEAAHERVKTLHRQSLVTGTTFNRATLASANEAVLAARDRLDMGVMELQAARQEAIQKAASTHVRALNTRISKTLERHRLEDIT